MCPSCSFPNCFLSGKLPGTLSPSTLRDGEAADRLEECMTTQTPLLSTSSTRKPTPWPVHRAPLQAASHPHHEPVLMRKASLNVIVPLSKSPRSRVYSLGPYSEDGEEENNSLYIEGAYLIFGAMLPTLPNVFFFWGGGLKVTLSSSQQSRNNQFSPAVWHPESIISFLGNGRMFKTELVNPLETFP